MVTVRRWIRTTLAGAGIDTSKYGAQSTRSASTSAAKGNSIFIATIMKSAWWSQESTFTKFYHKPVEHRANLGLNFLTLYVVTTKIVSLREHVIKVDSCCYKSLLSYLCSH